MCGSFLTILLKEGKMDKGYSKFCCEEAMKWYGWGSPVGLSIFFISLGICAILIRFVIIGF